MTVWTEMAGGTGDSVPAEAFTPFGCRSEEIIPYKQYINTMNWGQIKYGQNTGESKNIPSASTYFIAETIKGAGQHDTPTANSCRSASF